MTFKIAETLQEVKEHFRRSHTSVILELEQRQNAKGRRLCSSVEDAEDFEVKIRELDRQSRKEKR